MKLFLVMFLSGLIPVLIFIGFDLLDIGSEAEGSIELFKMIVSLHPIYLLYGVVGLVVLFLVVYVMAMGFEMLIHAGAKSEFRRQAKGTSLPWSMSPEAMENWLERNANEK